MGKTRGNKQPEDMVKQFVVVADESDVGPSSLTMTQLAAIQVSGVDHRDVKAVKSLTQRLKEMFPELRIGWEEVRTELRHHQRRRGGGVVKVGNFHGPPPVRQLFNNTRR